MMEMNFEEKKREIYSSMFCAELIFYNKFINLSITF